MLQFTPDCTALSLTVERWLAVTLHMSLSGHAVERWLAVITRNSRQSSNICMELEQRIILTRPVLCSVFFVYLLLVTILIVFLLVWCLNKLSPRTDKFARVEIFQLWHEFRVMTANQRSTAWPLSDMCNVTANQRSSGQLNAVQSGVNCSMEDKVIVTVCDSRSSIYNSI